MARVTLLDGTTHPRTSITLMYREIMKVYLLTTLPGYARKCCCRMSYSCLFHIITPNQDPPQRAMHYLCEFPILRTVLVGVCGPWGPGDVGGVRRGGEVRSKGAEFNDATALHMRVFPTREVAALLISPSVTMSTRQTGHSSCLSSHSKMQSLWKMWVQYFDAIKTSPSSAG